MSCAKKQSVSSPHDSNPDSSRLSQFIWRAVDEKCVCVSVSLLKYWYIPHEMVCLTRSQSGNGASIRSIFSALGSWLPCLSPGYKGNICEEIAGDLTSSDIMCSATISRLYSSRVWNSRLARLLSSKLFLWPKDILSVLTFLSHSFPPSLLPSSQAPVSWQRECVCE